MSTPQVLLQDIAEQIITCTRCELHHLRKNAVPGVGNPHSKIMFIGEGPGFHENEQGLPFVGAAGTFLDELLAQAGLKREDVFITNVVKCRPPGNRDPEPNELEACKAYLDQQMTAINPDVIVTLGRVSMSRFIQNGKISQIHGQKFHVGGRTVIPMYHPAAALHQPSLRNVVKEDFANLPKLLKEAQAKRQSVSEQKQTSQKEARQKPTPDHDAQQLSLF